MDAPINTNSEQDQRTGPSKAWYFISLVIFLVFAVGGIVFFFVTIFTSLNEGTQFIVPGELIVTIDKPGKYGLLNETSTVFKGKMYSGSSELPHDLMIRITELSTGRTLPLQPSLNGTETFGSRVRYPIGNVEFDYPGKYRIEVAGNFSERIFLLRRSICAEILFSAVLFLFASIIGWIGAPLLAIIVFAKRSSIKKKIARQPMVSENGTAGEEHFAEVVVEGNEATWATFCHLGAFAGYLFPLANIFVPLIIWLAKKDEFTLVDDQGKESLNFQISMMIYYIVSALLSCILIGIVFLVGLNIFNLIVVIVASVKANKGEKFRYPLCIRFIR